MYGFALAKPLALDVAGSNPAGPSIFYKYASIAADRVDNS